MNFKAKLYVTLRKSILDPQGTTIQRSLTHVGYEGIEKVRVGKLIELDLAAASRQEAEAKLKEISNKVLTNPIMEDFTYELTEVK